MPVPIARQVYVWEDAAATFLARIKGDSGAFITQASLTGITYKVYDRSDGSAVTTGTVTVSSAVFDALQTSDARWEDEATKGDTTGFNFEFQVPGTAFPKGDIDYQVEFWFDPVTGEDFAVVFAPVTSRNTYGG